MPRPSAGTAHAQVLEPPTQPSATSARNAAAAPGASRADQYVALDSGHLVVWHRYVPVFEKLGWTTFDQVFNAPRFQVIRRVTSDATAERDNCELRLPDPHCDGTVLAYAKRHQGRHLWAWLGSRLRGRPWLAPGTGEALRVAACRRAGVPTMNVIAAGQKTGRRPWEARSLFISEAIEGAREADEFWSQSIDPPGSGPPGRQRRMSLLTEMARITRLLHRAGLFHRDLYWCHFFVSEPRPGQFQVHLIDLQRQRGRPVGFRSYATIKDLGQFTFSMPPPPGGPTDQEKRHWFEQYRGTNKLGWIARLQLSLVRGRAALYHVKESRR